jgi:hypothetical protein
VILFAQPGNLASRAVAVRAGFDQSGTKLLGDGLVRIIYERRRPAR